MVALADHFGAFIVEYFDRADKHIRWSVYLCFVLNS